MVGNAPLVKNSYGVLAPCNAPFNNMYITLQGYVSPCWKLPGRCDQWSHDRSLMDIWRGEHFQKYRDALKQNQFLSRCQECKKEIDDGVWPLAKAYEKFVVRDMPSLMEIELSNQCNLECTMCNGNLSSGIRKNRDKLPPLPQIFDDTFNEQMREFIPHLDELRVNGGEPFAQKILLDLLDIVAEINPDLKVNIATNGTVYNKRVQSILDKCNIHLNISIDSLIPSRYEEIRINGKFDVLMKNFEIFKDYCNTNNRDLSIMVNPMNNNWDEMINFVKFTHEHNTNLWFNTILYPTHLTLKHLPYKELINISDYMKKEIKYVKEMKNYDVAEHLITQIENWCLDSKIGDVNVYDDKGKKLEA
jgi:radical SAM protein with 4Fe4S-binding SPASM domain